MANGRRPFVPEQPPRIDATTSRVRNWAWSQFRKLRNYLRELEETLVGLGGISTIGEVVPGTGNVWDDINAHCFSGPDSDGACRICIGPADIAYFGHNNVVYRWLGPTEICLGSGGAGGTYPHYLATSNDLVATGSTDHSVLSNRDQPNQHPQSAVTDLITDQNVQNSRLSALEIHPPRTDNPHSVTHTQLPDKGTNDHAAVDAHIADTDLHVVAHALPDVAKDFNNIWWSTPTKVGDYYASWQGSEISNAPWTLNPSGVYLISVEMIVESGAIMHRMVVQGVGDWTVNNRSWLRTGVDQNTMLTNGWAEFLMLGSAVETFSFAAYETLEAPTNSSFPNLGGAYQKVNVLTAPSSVTGRGITVNRPNSTFAFDYDGVYRITVNGSMEHNSSNQGRTFMVRFYDEIDADYIGDGMVIGTGRNAEATTIPAALLLEIVESDKGHDIALHIGNGDTYTSVSFQVLGIDINSVSEWREPLT